MAGHSQFKNIMHRKGRQDKVKSKLFGKLAREITVSAKIGIPDPAMNPRLRAAVLAAGVAGFAAAAARSDDCETMTKTVQVLIDKMDPSAKGGDNPAKLCAAYGEGLGLIKSFRIVADECLDEGDERSQTLAKLDRSIRQLQSQVDKNCE